MYINESQVRGYSSRTLYKSFGRRLVEDAAARSPEVFLSHSHLDTDLVEDIIAWLDTQGLHVYVDWRDPGMPAETSAETANRIRTKITQCNFFLLLATNRALRSRWVPWELGYCDGTKGVNKTLILPVADPAGNWEGAEYLRIYPSVESTSDNKWAVFPAGQDKGGKLLEHLLK